MTDAKTKTVGPFAVFTTDGKGILSVRKCKKFDQEDASRERQLYDAGEVWEFAVPMKQAAFAPELLEVCQALVDHVVPLLEKYDDQAHITVGVVECTIKAKAAIAKVTRDKE